MIGDKQSAYQLIGLLRVSSFSNACLQTRTKFTDIYWILSYIDESISFTQLLTMLKVKVGFLCSAAYAMTGPARFTISEVAVDWQEPVVLQRKLRPSNCTRFKTYNWTRVMKLANTPPLQSTVPGLHPQSIHQTSPLRARKQTSAYSLLLNLSTSKG